MVVSLLAEHGALTRADLARRLGVSRAAMSIIVRRLVEDKLVVERDSHEPRSLAPAASKGAGVLVTLNPSAAVAIGIDFSHQAVRTVVSDLSHSLIAEEVRELPLDYDAKTALDMSADLIAKMLRGTRVEKRKVLGVGLGVPGPIDHRNGLVTPSSISNSWLGFRVADYLANRTSLPVRLDNNATLGALAEATWGTMRNYHDALYVKVSSGVGAGILASGQICRGVSGIAGEIGHITVAESGPMCRCGNRGCLEAYIGLPAQLALLRPIFGPNFTAKDLELLAHDGDPRCLRVLADVGRHLGSVLANICNALNPAVIVLGGELAALFEFVADEVRNTIARQALDLVARSVQVLPGTLGERAEALGAVALILHDTELLGRVLGSTRSGLTQPSVPGEKAAPRARSSRRSEAPRGTASSTER